MPIRPDPPQPRVWERFVALGDSFTEGMSDAHPTIEDLYVGWADRVAMALDERNTQLGASFGYANLAIRGRLIDAVIEEQLLPALALEPDLVSVSAGGNDVLRPRVSVQAVMDRLEKTAVQIRETGADVILVTAPDVSWAPLVNRVHPRMAEYTANLWAVGQRTGAFVVDIYTLRALHDARMYAPDRIHLSSEGHARVAAQALWTLGVEVEEGWTAPLEVIPPVGRLEALQSDREWVATSLRPWIRRRLRGESSGDGRTPKRPRLGPLEPIDEAPARADEPSTDATPASPHLPGSTDDRQN